MAKRFWVEILYMLIGMAIAISLDIPYFFVPTLTLTSFFCAIGVMTVSIYTGRILFWSIKKLLKI